MTESSRTTSLTEGSQVLLWAGALLPRARPPPLTKGPRRLIKVQCVPRDTSWDSLTTGAFCSLTDVPGSAMPGSRSISDRFQLLNMPQRNPA